MRGIRDAAAELKECALAHDPGVMLLGNVTAREVALIAADIVDDETVCNEVDCERCDTAFAALKRRGG